MKLYSENENYKLYYGNMLNMLDVIKPNSIDSTITDPPYELNFMSKGWDNAGVSFQADTWKKCFEVLKPGGYLLAFGGSRTFHRIACAIEDAGFEIRDTIMWLYGSGFPKSMDISKQIDKRNGRNEKEFKELGNYLKEKITDSDSVCAKKTGFSSALVRFWKLGERIPNKETWSKLKSIYDLDNDFDWLIEREEAKREIIGNKKTKDFSKHNGSMMSFITTDDYKTDTTDIDITAPSTDLAKQWQGWGTALKPSFEPIIVARKPFKGSLVNNIIENGVGGINIDECRVAMANEDREKYINKQRSFKGVKDKNYDDVSSSYSFPHLEDTKENTIKNSENGRFPANTILTYDESDFDEVCGGFPNTKSGIAVRHNSGGNTFGGNNKKPPMEDLGYNDSGSASRYFYCAKASKRDRDEGLDNQQEQKVNDGRQTPIDNPFQRGETPRKNTHPTVKPTSLMQYLVRLVTPKGGTVLDPFNGSGSTGKAVMYENHDRNRNYKYIGIELTEEYLPIAQARIEYVCNLKDERQTSIDEFLD